MARRWIGTLLVLVAALGACGEAHGGDRHLAGVGLGVGVRASSQDLLAVGPEVGLPSLELGFFGPGEHSVDLSIPVLRMIASPLLLERLWLGLDLFRTFRLGGGAVVGVLAPGGGFVVNVGKGDGAGGVRVAARLGVELRNPRGGFALGVFAQPNVLVELGDLGTAVSGGAMLWVRFAWIRPLS